MNQRTLYIKDADWEALERVRLYLVSTGDKCPSKSAALAWLIHSAEVQITSKSKKKAPEGAIGS